MKKIITLIILIILIAIPVWWYFDSTKLCGSLYSWGRNTKTGQCRYFRTTCLDKGYEAVSIKKCDCSNLEKGDASLQSLAVENCIANQEN